MTPKLDIEKTESAYEVTAELPGMDEDEVEITVSKGRLEIKGEKRREEEKKENSYYLKERSYGQFRRVLAIPSDVDENDISAASKKGVLALTLPKTKKAEEVQRRIPVKRQ